MLSLPRCFSLALSAVSSSLVVMSTGDGRLMDLPTEARG